MWWHKTKILEVTAGSHAYGLATPESDIDIRGVCMLPAKYLLGLSKFEQGAGPGDDQITYGLPKFVSLALACNPNIIEMLFSAGHYRLLAPYGECLLAQRHLFMSTRIKHTFSGYAFSQLGRIERHHRWLVDPPNEPKQESFGGVWDGSTFRWPDVQMQRGYDNARKHYQDYQTWRKNRNPARAVLEEKFGYDTKHAMHLCRLMVMAKEALTYGYFTVDRTSIDADWLRGVRNGYYSYEGLVEWAKQASDELDTIVSPLPKKPDTKAVDTLLISMQEDYLRTSGV